MALFGSSEQALEIVIRARDEASKVIAGVEKQSEQFRRKIDELQPAFRKMALVGTASFTAVAGAISLSVAEAIRGEATQHRLSHVLKTATKATDDQVQALFDQAEALEKVGVVAADSIIQAQAQLATFDLQAESIARLTPAILDYVVAEKGANASTEDLKQLTNGLAQALNGNFTSLTQTGFVLDEATRELIKNGTEAERTAALVTVLNSTYKGFNESARDTAEGSLVAMRNEFNNLRETIGAQFLPALEAIAERLTPIIVQVQAWIAENPTLTRNILIAAAAISGLVAVVGLLGLALPVIIAGFTFLAGPVGLVIAILGTLMLTVRNVVGIMDAFSTHWDEVWDGVKITISEVWASIKTTISSTIDWIIEKFNTMVSIVTKPFSIAGNAISSVGSAISSFVNPNANYSYKEHGGTVPGPVGAAVPIMAHGQETIIPAGQRAGGSGVTVNLNISSLMIRDENDMDTLTRKVEDVFRGLLVNHKIEVA